ncbi:MAG: hypothetical protein ACPL7D_02885 [Candidatus Sumerlaeaceae bacterium]
MASYVGHNAIRAAVVGYDAVEPNAEQLNQMCRELQAAIDAGALGFSTGLIYPPGLFADSEEMRRLQAQAAQRGGCYASHVRTEEDLLLRAADEFLDITVSTNSQGQFSHLKASGSRNWGKVVHVLDALECAVERGAFCANRVG